MPDIGRFVIIEVAESSHTLRAALRVGEIISVRGTAPPGRCRLTCRLNG
jgi:hypothetical protein